MNDTTAHTARHFVQCVLTACVAAGATAVMNPSRLIAQVSIKKQKRLLQKHGVRVVNALLTCLNTESKVKYFGQNIHGASATSRTCYKDSTTHNKHLL